MHSSTNSVLTNAASMCALLRLFVMSANVKLSASHHQKGDMSLFVPTRSLFSASDVCAQ